MHLNAAGKSLICVISLLVIVKCRVFANPPYLSSILPLALLLNTFFAYVHSNAVLLALLPLSNVLAAISPDEGALAFTLVINKVTLVLLPVLPGEYALTVHLVFRPISSV